MGSFESPGKFRLPSTPPRRIAGKLVVDGVEIALTVHESLRQEEAPADQVIELVPEQI